MTQQEAHEALIEKMARVICAEEGNCYGVHVCDRGPPCKCQNWQAKRDHARAALSVVREALAEPSDRMHLAIMDAKEALAPMNVAGMTRAQIRAVEGRHLLRAIISASPLSPGET